MRNPSRNAGGETAGTHVQMLGNTRAPFAQMNPTTLIENARDPLWQFVGVLLALAAMVLSYRIYVGQKQQKRLTYQRLASFPLLTVKEALAGRISVAFDGNPVQSIHMITLRIRCAGNLPITVADYVKPLALYVEKAARVLSADIVESLPSNLRPVITVDAGSVTVEPLLLNPGDSFVVKLLVQDGSKYVFPEARIVGVREVERVLDPDSKLELVAQFGMLIFCVGNLIALAFRAPRVEVPSTPGEYFGWSIMGAGGAVWLSCTAWRIWVKRKASNVK